MQKPREIVIVSGKGGTGKTTITASFAVLARRCVVADCDVDASDLHLLLAPKVVEHHEFRSGHEAIIREDACTGCGKCYEVCRFDAVSKDGNRNIFSIDKVACDGCGVCVHFCPAQAIDFPERTCGEWMKSETRTGPMVHAHLGIAAENSGKLVSVVRTQARQTAIDREIPLVLIDGPPGIGCPVIASITGADLVVVVTEPTVSGEHDLERVLNLTRHFGIASVVSVNKWDLNPEMADRIEQKASELGATIAERIQYDRSVTAAQIEAKTPVEVETAVGSEIRKLWKQIASIGG